MGIKVALAVFSSYTNDDIDRIDKVSPTQVRREWKVARKYHQKIIKPCNFKTTWVFTFLWGLSLLYPILQAILGTVISAVTGSENPQEVAIMAKQATDVSIQT